MNYTKTSTRKTILQFFIASSITITNQAKIKRPEDR